MVADTLSSVPHNDLGCLSVFRESKECREVKVKRELPISTEEWAERYVASNILSYQPSPSLSVVGNKYFTVQGDQGDQGPQGAQGSKGVVGEEVCMYLRAIPNFVACIKFKVTGKH